MPFKTFTNWLFDGNPHSEIPAPRNDPEGKVIVPDILKYNSPITNQYVISIFLKNGALNRYLNTYLNNGGVWYLEKEDLFKFIKRCVIDFRIKRYDLVYYKRQKEDALFKVVSEKIPYFKNDDIRLFCNIIDNSESRDAVYQGLELEKPVKEKIKIGKKVKKKKISVKDLLSEHFTIMNT